MLSTDEVDVFRIDTPIISADSCRVETEERRRWCELRFGFPIGGREGEDGGGLFDEGEGDIARDNGMF